MNFQEVYTNITPTRLSHCQVAAPINIKEVQEYIHGNISFLSKKLIAFMLAVIESYPMANFNSR